MTAPRHRSHAPVLAVRGGLDYGIPPASSSAGVICQAMFGLAYTPAEEAFRVELRAWLGANLPRAPAPEEEGERRRFQRAWQRALAAGGWVGIQWPRAHGGRGASLREQIIFTEEMARAQAPEILDPVSVNIVGPTLIRFGTPAQQARWLPPIRPADQVWCLGFSEPNAGSDLASLRCRARRDGDHWVVSGQKVWSSQAHFADCCLLLVRADLAAFRPRVAQAWIEAEVFGAHTLRILPRLHAAADAPPEAALQKLFGSEIQQRTLELAMALAGPYAQLGRDARAPDAGAWAEAYLYSRSVTISSG